MIVGCRHLKFLQSLILLLYFEHVYFARPDSIIFGDSVHEVRKEMGRQLARECQVEADLVMAIPDSGNSAALGYAQESGIPYEIGMTQIIMWAERLFNRLKNQGFIG